MAPFDWITPEKVYNTLDILMVILAVGLGVVYTALWVGGPSDAVFFGVDLDLLLALAWFVVASLSVLRWIFRRRGR